MCFGFDKTNERTFLVSLTLGTFESVLIFYTEETESIMNVLSLDSCMVCAEILLLVVKGSSFVLKAHYHGEDCSGIITAAIVVYLGCFQAFFYCCSATGSTNVIGRGTRYHYQRPPGNNLGIPAETAQHKLRKAYPEGGNDPASGEITGDIHRLVICNQKGN